MLPSAGSRSSSGSGPEAQGEGGGAGDRRESKRPNKSASRCCSRARWVATFWRGARRRGDRQRVVNPDAGAPASPVRAAPVRGRRRDDGDAHLHDEDRAAARRGRRRAADGDNEADRLARTRVSPSRSAGSRAPAHACCSAPTAASSRRPPPGRSAATTFASLRARAGRVKLVVQSAGLFRPAGTLDVRPVSLDAVGDVTFGEERRPGDRRARRRVPVGVRRLDAAPRRHHRRQPRDGRLDTRRRRREGVHVPRAARCARADAGRRRLRRADAREQPHGRLRPRRAARHASRPCTPPGSRRSAPARTICRRDGRRSSRRAACASRSSATPT